MSTTGSRAEREQCPQKESLIGDVRKVIDQILAIHNEHVESILNGNFETSDDVERRLKQAREHKARLIDRYREHVASHGC